MNNVYNNVITMFGSFRNNMVLSRRRRMHLNASSRNSYNYNYIWSLLCIVFALSIISYIPVKAENSSNVITVESSYQIKRDAIKDLDKHQIYDIPNDIQALCEQYGQEYNICPELIEALIWKESRFTADAQNGKCVGLCQVNYVIHAERTDKPITSKEGNIEACTNYLADLFYKYEDPTIVLNIYGGYGNVETETSYSKEVLNISADLERIHGK